MNILHIKNTFQMFKYSQTAFKSFYLILDVSSPIGQRDEVVYFYTHTHLYIAMRRRVLMTHVLSTAADIMFVFQNVPLVTGVGRLARSLSI